jgi:hypothetical protein
MQNLLIFHQSRTEGILILKKEYKAESLEEVTLQIEHHIYLIYSEVYERKLCGKKNPDHFKKCMLQAFSLFF